MGAALVGDALLIGCNDDVVRWHHLLYLFKTTPQHCFAAQISQCFARESAGCISSRYHHYI
jgi:hypothetical protein